VKDCPHRLDVQRLTAEQREELIEDLMALKDRRRGSLLNPRGGFCLA